MCAEYCTEQHWVQTGADVPPGHILITQQAFPAWQAPLFLNMAFVWPYLFITGHARSSFRWGFFSFLFFLLFSPDSGWVKSHLGMNRKQLEDRTRNGGHY